MYLTGASLDKSRELTLFARVNEDSSPIVLRFFEDGADYDISSLDFQLLIRQTDSSTSNLILLTVGDGLTVNGNELTIQLTQSQSSVRPREYFYRLFSVTENTTWLNGAFIFHSGKFDGVNQTTQITIGDSIVTIQISGGSGTSIQFQDEGVDLGNNRANTVNFTGSRVEATRSGDTITVNIDGGVPAPTSFLGLFRINANDITPPPTSGRIRYNNADQTLATQLFVHDITQDGIDIALFLSLLKSGDILVIQDKNERADYQYFQINGAPVDNTTYFTIPVTFQSAGGDGTDFPHNTDVFIGRYSVISGVVESVDGDEPGIVDNTDPANPVISLQNAYDYTDTGLATKQDSLGFTPENVVNKATGFGTLNDTLYPTVQAVETRIDSKIAAIPNATALLQSVSFANRVNLKSGTFENHSQFVADYNRVFSYMTPSWMLTANAYGISKLFTAFPATDKGSLTFSRSTTRRRVNLFGDVQESAINVPGIDYVSGVGYFNPEKASSNLCLYSEDFTNAAWVKTNITITANNDTAPDLTNTADLLTITNATNEVYQDISGFGSVNNITISFWAKRGTAASLNYRIYDNTNAADIVASTNYYSQLNSLTYTRVVVTFARPAGCASVRLYLSNNSGTGTFFAWGVQLEALQHVTSYIPTTNLTVNRGASSISALTGVSNLIGQTQGTLYFEASSFSDGISKFGFCLSDGTISNRIAINYNTGNTLRCVITQGGAPQANLTTALAPTTLAKICVTYESNNARIFVNGVLANSDASVVVPACNSIRFDDGAGTDGFYGFFRTAAISTVKISDANAILLTT